MTDIAAYVSPPRREKISDATRARVLDLCGNSDLTIEQIAVECGCKQSYVSKAAVIAGLTRYKFGIATERQRQAIRARKERQ